MSKERKSDEISILENALENIFSEDFRKILDTDGKHRIIQRLLMADELLNRYEFKIGTRVQMTKDLLDTEDRGRGWDHSCGHFLCKWNVGNVVGISHIRDSRIMLLVQWDFQPTRDGTENKTSKFPFSESDLKIATIDKPKIPKDFKLPDDPKDKLVKKKEVALEKLNYLENELREKEKEIHRIKKEISELDDNNDRCRS